MTNTSLEHVDASLARWNSRLRRAVTAIKKLEAKRKRLLNVKPKPALPISTQVAAVVTVKKPVEDVTDISFAEMTGADLGIPDFLKRSPVDQKAAVEIKTEAETRKKAKAKGAKAREKARLSGSTRKMPLSGKAALDFIRNG
jgi:hypothetical protein